MVVQCRLVLEVFSFMGEMGKMEYTSKEQGAKWNPSSRIAGKLH